MNWRDMPFAPDTGTSLGHLDQIPDGGISEAQFGEGKDTFKVMLIREGQNVQAYLNRCPHYGVPLNTEPNKFFILSDRQVMCAVHCAVFRMDDGACVDGPVKGDHLTSIDVQVDAAGDIRIAD